MRKLSNDLKVFACTNNTGRVAESQRLLLMFHVTSLVFHHQIDTLASQTVGVPGAIDHEVLHLLKSGLGDDLCNPLDVLARQVRDQSQHIVGAVVYAPLTRECRSELFNKTCYHFAVDLTDNDLHSWPPVA